MQVQGNALVCRLGDLPAGAVATILLAATPTQPGLWKLVATAGAAEPDPFPFNNRAAVATAVIEPSLSIADLAIVEKRAGNSDAVFTVRLSDPVDRLVTVGYRTIGGSAQAGADFVATNGTLAFAPGQVVRTLKVPVIGNTNHEPDRTFTVQLENPTHAILAVATARGLIVDDDPLPRLTIKGAQAAEGDAGTTEIPFVVTLLSKSASVVAVDYATADGTALADRDYAPRGGRVEFPPGTTTQTVAVPVFGNIRPQTDRSFTVRLSNPAGATLYGADAIGRILDDDNIRLVGRVALDTVTVRFATAAKLPYRVEWTETLEGLPEWRPLAGWERYVGSGATAIAVDPDPGDRPQRFYRVRRLPAEP